MNYDDFKRAVSSAIDAGMTEELACKFSIANSTVRRWGEGTAKPHPLIVKMVLDHLSIPSAQHLNEAVNMTLPEYPPGKPQRSGDGKVWNKVK